MSDREPLLPWAEGTTAVGSDLERQVADLFRRVEVPLAFDPRRVSLPLLAARRRSRPRRLALWLTGAVLMGSVGVVAAAKGIAPLTQWLRSRLESIEVQPKARGQVAPPTPAAEVAVLAPPASSPALVGEPIVEPTRARAPGAPSTVRRAPAAKAVAHLTPESSLARETRLLGEAFSLLHRQDDAAAALARLDAHAQAFPRGLLRKEAASVRVEALLKLGRHRQALAVLRAFPFGKGARDTELRLLRGELGAAWDCRAAIRDFEAVLQTGAPPALAERAVHGRSACLARIAATGAGEQLVDQDASGPAR